MTEADTGPRPRIGLVLLVVGLVVATVIGVIVRQNLLIADEWEHGDDEVQAQAEVRALEPGEFGAALTSLGVPEEAPDSNAVQMVVVDLTWTDAPADSDAYAYVLVDARADPPEPVDGHGLWNVDRDKGTGPDFNRGYGDVANHFGWLARASNYTAWLTTDAGTKGHVVLTFALGERESPLLTPQDDLRLAMVGLREGQPRWVKEVELVPGAAG